MIADTVASLQKPAVAKGITLSSDMPPQMPAAYADPTRVRQILIILVDNAIKFTPAGGVIKVRARVFEKDPRFLLLENREARRDHSGDGRRDILFNDGKRATGER